ncbi:MAG: cation-transporting P-type ATPase [Acidimicrobiales bacterium]|nr:cation-transporting P-type ATPase [Acidimicrobiales bacterium]
MTGTQAGDVPRKVPTGLSAVEAGSRQEAQGPNRLPPPRAVPAWRKLGAEFVNLFALMLWVAGGLALLGGLVPLGFAIFAVVVLNGVFAFGQEYRAERAAASLRDLLPRRATVLRDGQRRDVDASELVVGDTVWLEPGDRVSADLVLGEAHGILVNTSTLTGESVPSPADEGEELFAGTFLVEGTGFATVEAIGADTRLASIAQLTTGASRPRTPLHREIQRVVRTLAVIAVSLGSVFFVLSLLLGQPASDGFLFAIGVTVAVVPCGLLPTVTLSLAVGAQRMAARHALVRRLESVETLGSTTFICSDKTGTLTRNEMQVVAVWTPSGSVEVDGVGYEPVGQVRDEGQASRERAVVAAGAAVACSTGYAVERGGEWVTQGDPMEVALDVVARRLGVDTEPIRATAPDRIFPFDPRRRRMSVVRDGWVLVKGAPDAVLPRCAAPADAQRPLDALSARGLRVIAVARRRDDGPEDAEEAERELELLALMALEDPPRSGAAHAVAACRRAGISVAMVTGDHPATARAIADQVGLRRPHDPVITGADLPADSEVLAALIDHDGIVLSRVTPEDKLRIARALRSRGHVVAMTGDGVNDGPALRESDIGIAMGRSGTDVARDAADLVLLDDDFATIVAAIEQGRATFANMRRFLTYHLTDNVAELTPFVIWALSGGRFPLALGVLQVLALDIGTDTLPAVALGGEAPTPGVLDRRPSEGRLINSTVAFRAFGVLGPTEALVSMTAFVTVFLAMGWSPGEPFPEGHVLDMASGAAFTAVVVGQMANAFACRSTTRWPGRLGWTSNRLLLWAVGFEVLLAAAFIGFAPLADLLGQAPPPLAGWLVVASAAPAVLAADTLAKVALRRRARRQRHGLTSDDGRGVPAAVRGHR